MSARPRRAWLPAVGRWSAAGATAGALLGSLNWATAFASDPFARAYLVALALLGAGSGLLAGAASGLLLRPLRRPGAAIPCAGGERGVASSRRLSPLVRRIWAVLVGAGLTALAAYLGSAPRFAGLLSDAPRSPATARSGPPNLILVSLDTVRPDHLGAYGYPRPISPSFDALAARGTLLGRCVATSPQTIASHASLLTGLPPSRLGWGGIGRGAAERSVIPDRAVTLAEALRGAGYHTAGFTGSDTVGSRHGFDQGFEIFNDRLPPSLSGASESLYGTRLLRSLLAIDSARLLRFLDPAFIALSNFLHEEAQRLPSELQIALAGGRRQENGSDEVNQKVFAWLDRRPPRPFFLFVHYFDAHDPYEPPPRFAPAGQDPAFGYIVQNGLERRLLEGGGALTERERQRLEAAYDGEIAAVDHALGLLLERLDAEGVLDNAVLAVVSDHGESFGEHGLIRHGRQLYDESTRAVFLLAGRGVPAGRVVEMTVSGLDVAPTLLDLCEGETPAGVAGRSLKPVVGGAVMEPRPVYAEAPGRYEGAGAAPAVVGALFSVEVDGLKMIREDGAPGVLFDLEEDPGEERDLSGERPEEASRLGSLLTEYISRSPLPEPGSENRTGKGPASRGAGR